MGVDMEMSCDERVLKEIGCHSKKDYLLCLLSMATGRRVIAGSPLAFGEGGMKERVRNVLQFKKQSRAAIIATVALVALLSAGFVTTQAGGANGAELSERSLTKGVAPALLSYSMNKRGQTFGDAMMASSIETLPDLIHAGSVDNVKGYVYAKDLLDAMPKTEEEARAIVNRMPSITMYQEDGVTVIGNTGFGGVPLPESIRNMYMSPIYPINENGQTYGPLLADPYTPEPDLIAAVGIDGTEGYIYNSIQNQHGGYPPPQNPEEAIEYMRWLDERKEEMKRNGEKYILIVPLYAEDGVTVIGEYGIG